MQQFNTLKNERLEKRTKLAKIQKEKYIKKRVCVEIVGLNCVASTLREEARLCG